MHGHTRQTRQRELILEELRRACSHPTAADLYQVARRRLPKISLGTVYRNLELLARVGVIRRIEATGAAETRFDADTRPHYHVRCVRCGRVDDALGLSGEPVREQIKRLNGYDILAFRLEFVGICPSCQVRRESGIGGGERTGDEGAVSDANPSPSRGAHAVGADDTRSQEGE